MVDLLITGANGQLGRAAQRVAGARSLRVVGHDLDTLDIRDPEAVEGLVAAIHPRTVINCAAYTAVDACETDEPTALEVNGTAVGHLARACNANQARLIQISTDYVFPGDGDRPYTETDATGPVSAYGRSKLLGEECAALARHHLILRTAWLFGSGGSNFVQAIRRQLDLTDDPLRVVDDQVGSPTLTDDLAAAILDLDAVGATGIVHVVNSGSTSWYGFACEIVRQLGHDRDVVPVPTAEFPRPAARPSFSVLDTSRLKRVIGRTLPPWQDALRRHLENSCGS